MQIIVRQEAFGIWSMISEYIPLTTIAGTVPVKPIFHGPLFRRWLQQKNLSPSTVRHHLRACGRRMTYLHHTDSSTQIAWIEWTAPDGEKRLTGFAVRKYEQFADEVLGDVSTFGVPRKSRPDPHPIQRRDIRKMRLASV